MTAEPVSTELAELLDTCGTCLLWAEQDEGPYRREAPPVRRDVVEGRQGAPLHLGLRLTFDGNPPPGDARVEIWQCDALGRYSGFPPPDASVIVTAATAPRVEYLPDETFLRGTQTADAAGMVEFRTIYPGWYPGRTVHIHVIVRTTDAVYTSQLYFPDDLSDDVLASAPYSRRPGRETTNDTDEIFSTGGAPAMLDVTRANGGFRAVVRLVLAVAPVTDEREVDRHLGVVLNEVLDTLYQAKQAAWSASGSPAQPHLRAIVAYLIDQSRVLMEAEERIEGRAADIASPSSHQRGNIVADGHGDITAAIALLVGRLDLLAADVRARAATIPDAQEAPLLTFLATGLETCTAPLRGA